MNLIKGQLLDTKQSKNVIDTLQEQITITLSKESYDTQIVVDACDQLVRDINDEKYISTMIQLGIDSNTARRYLKQAKIMFGRDYLEARLAKELGEGHKHEKRFTPLYNDSEVCEYIMPIGVLLHIVAGNVDGLPAFSVFEGLLTGNINILKLPEVDGGISIRLLMELIEIEPKLAEYIYVFDYSSKDEKSISKLIKAADAVVVWGSDIAANAMWRMVDPDTKLIEWGQKISFAYITKGGIDDEKLRGLAYNICSTEQLLCNSCQGIFIDTDDMEEVYSFCEYFLPILDDMSLEFPTHNSIGTVSQITLELYNEELESIYDHRRTYRRNTCSIIAYKDSDLELSIKYRNCWVKPLPREKLLKTLQHYKNHLQTVALLCEEAERSSLIKMLAKTGIVRISGGDKMSSTYCGAAHDGEYSLRRYTKIVSVE